MSLLGLPFLFLVAAVSLGVAGGTWAMWNRWPVAGAIPGRALSLLLVMIMGGTSAAAYANYAYGFYASFDDLIGSIPAQRYQPPSTFDTPHQARASVTVLTPDWPSLAQSNAAAGHGTLLSVLFPGSHSGISRRGLLYLPAAYVLGSQEAGLPVIEMFNGYPGKPSNFPRLLNLGPTIDAEIAANRIPPVMVAIPTVYEHRSSECVNAVRGEKDETYLAVDVPADISTTFRTAQGRSFGALGYSEGGFCAANLGLHHPDRYAAVVSLSGYFTAGFDPKTVGYLYGHRQSALDFNSPLWWVQHRNPTGPPLWLMSSTGDPDSIRQARQMRDAARKSAPRLVVVTPVVDGGGHNFNTWLTAFPAALDFLAGNLPSALAPPLTLPLLPGGPLPPTRTSPVPVPVVRPTRHPTSSPRPSPTAVSTKPPTSPSPSPTARLTASSAPPRPSGSASPRAS